MKQTIGAENNTKGTEAVGMKEDIIIIQLKKRPPAKSVEPKTT